MYGGRLAKILRSDPAIRRYPFEIYCWGEKWKQIARVPASFVFNTDARSRGRGEHWVAVFIDRDWSADYFDSYGTAPLRRVYNWLTAAGCTPIRYSKKLLQGPMSMTCASYCIYFLHMRAMGIPLEYITRTFRQYRFRLNDGFVRDVTKIMSYNTGGRLSD